MPLPFRFAIMPPAIAATVLKSMILYTIASVKGVPKLFGGARCCLMQEAGNFA